MINPARIVVTENAAVVHDYFYLTSTNTVGEEKKQIKQQGKFVEFHVKENGKWICLGDMTIVEYTKD